MADLLDDWKDPPELEHLLLEAVRDRDLAAVQQQLAAGANPSAAGHRGVTALHIAAVTGQRDVVSALLAAGADVSAVANIQLRYGCTTGPATPLLCTVQSMHDALVGSTPADRSEFYGPYCNFWPTQEGGDPPVPCKGCKCSDWCHQMAGVVQQLVAAGAQVEVAAAGDDQRKLLHYAAAAGCPTLVAALLQAGADPGSSTPDGYTVLHAAASSRSLEVVQQVLGALGPGRATLMLRESAVTRAGDSPLHTAALFGCLEVVEALVAAGADLDQPNSGGATALQRALSRGHCHLVPLLVTPGNANTLCTLDASWEGPVRTVTPLHIVARCLRGAQQAGAWPDCTDAINAVAALLAAGANALTKNHEGLTAAGVAAHVGHPEVLRVLLQHLMRQHSQQYRTAQQQRQPPLQQGLLHELRDAALLALCRPAIRPMVGELLELAHSTCGEEGVHSLWDDVKQALLDPQQSAGLPQVVRHGLDQHTLAECTRHVLHALGQNWAAACRQHMHVAGRLSQLCLSHAHHQQHGEAGRPSKRPRLARELRMLCAQQEQLVTTDAAAPSGAGGSSSTSSRAARAEARSRAAAAIQEEALVAAVVSGDASGVHAALGQLPDKAGGLLMGAEAAGMAGKWGLCMQLLRELVMLDAAKGQEAARAVGAAVADAPCMVWKVLGCVMRGDIEELKVLQRQISQAVLLVGDALLADWLAVRQERAREVKQAVVAAVTAAAAACHLYN